jgi:hypothetical protein
MRENITKLLHMPRLPARLRAEETAPLLGFEPHDLPVLVRARLLKPLGDPTPHSVKYYAACEIRDLAEDVEWLSKATKKIAEHWASQNKTRRATKPGVEETELAA